MVGNTACLFVAVMNLFFVAGIRIKQRKFNYWHDNYQWQYKKYSVKKLSFYYANLQIGESLVTAVEIWIFRKIIKTPGMEQKIFIKDKLLAWSAKSRKTPGMECKVQINSWHRVQSWQNSWHGVQNVHQSFNHIIEKH
jgi:hypothetical protein